MEMPGVDLHTHVARVDVKRDHLAIQLSANSEGDSAAQAALSRTRRARSSRSTGAGRPLEKDTVKTAA
jgi:hypothetical protein